MASSDPVHWREVGYILAGWVVIVVIAGVITAVSNPCNVTMPWPRLLANQSAQFGVWALLTPGIFWLTRVRVHPVHRFATLHVGGLAGALGIVAVLRPVIHNLSLHTPEERHEFTAWMGVSFVHNAHLDGLVYVGLLLAGVALTHYRRSQALERRAVALQARRSQAQLEVLQTQVNPHFLFNALNTISSLTEDDPATTRRVLARLSSLLRRSLDSSEDVEITLGEEMSFVRQYLEIMQIRYGGQLHVEIDVDPDLETALVPAFSLQMLVENAIQHGVSKIARTARIAISATAENDHVVVKIIDNGPGFDLEEPIAASGVGLANVRLWLRQLYGEHAVLSLANVRPSSADKSTAGACVTVRLPLRTTLMDPQRSSVFRFDGLLPQRSAFKSRTRKRVP